jgi:hemolysin activation/secretion protein
LERGLAAVPSISKRKNVVGIEGFQLTDARHGRGHVLAAAALLLAAGITANRPVYAAAEAAAEQATPAATAAQQPPKPTTPQNFDIDEIRVDGADALPLIEVEAAVYPFLGPHRSAADVEKARAALEQSYHDKGYRTVVVSIPPQNVDRHVIVLKVVEAKVGNLRVKNSRYFDLAKIKAKATSLKEGTLPNFNEISKDIVALNQWSDRRVTPALRAGVTPGTVDVDLNVEDKAPIHGSLEFNDRQSPNTTPDRIAATVHYDDLWQLGHSLSFSYQVAPERPNDAEVFSGSYLAHVTDSVNFLLYGLTSNSNVATVGGLNIVGPGQTIGGRAIITLPTQEGFFHTISLGADYKHFGQTVDLAGSSFSSPVTYYPFVTAYSASWQTAGALTQFNAGLTFNFRGPGSGFDEFDAKRFDADANFIHLNADLSHTRDLMSGYQLFTKLQGQVADGPLVSSEQFSAGGLDTVRGYLESETLGDDGVAATFEFRGPDVGAWLQSNLKNETGDGPARFTVFNECRLFGFADGGFVDIRNPLPGQQSQFSLASYGVGSRCKTFNTLNSMVVMAIPLVNQAFTHANDAHVLFRVWGEF